MESLLILFDEVASFPRILNIYLNDRIFKFQWKREAGGFWDRRGVGEE